METAEAMKQMRQSGIDVKIVLNAVSKVDPIRYLEDLHGELLTQSDSLRKDLLTVYHGIILDFAGWLREGQAGGDATIEKANQSITQLNAILHHNWYREIERMEAQVTAIELFLSQRNYSS